MFLFQKFIDNLYLYMLVNFQITIRVSNSRPMDTDKTRRVLRPDLGPNCF